MRLMACDLLPFLEENRYRKHTHHDGKKQPNGIGGQLRATTASPALKLVSRFKPVVLPRFLVFALAIRLAVITLCVLLFACILLEESRQSFTYFLSHVGTLLC